MFGFGGRIGVVGRKRRFSVFREYQNRYLAEYTKDLSAKRVLNLGSTPDASDKQGKPYEAYFPDAEFLTLDLGGSDHPRHTQADLMQLPADFGSFDLVLAMSVIEHIDRPWVAAPHITGLVRPGGYLYIAMPFFYPVHEGPYYGDHWRATPSAMRFLFEDMKDVRTDLYPSCLIAVKDRSKHWRDPANSYAGFSMLMRKL